MIKIFFFAILISIQAVLHSQNPDTLWTKTFGGVGRDQAISVIETVDTGYVLVGATDSYGNGLMDAWLIKTGENGNEIWNKTFGGSLNDRFGFVHQTTDGGYILAGSTESYGNGGTDLWLIKTDENGNEIWNKTFGGTNNDLAQFVHQTSDGGFIITGSTESFGNGSEDIWLIKVDGNGNEIWNKTYGGSFGERAYTVHQTNDNGYVLAGRTDSYGNGLMDAWLIKTDTNGNELWNKTFGGTETDNAYSLQVTFDEGYILAGYTKSSGSGEEDIWLIKTNGNGDEIWNKKFGGFGNDVTYSVQQTADSGYIISGFTNSSGNGGMDIWLIRTDTNGSVIWDKTYGGSLDDLAFSGQQTSDGGYIAAGSTHSYGNGQDDFYLIRLNADGFTAIENDRDFKLDNFLLMQNYPNPFNPTTIISYSIPQRGFTTLKVFDVLGKEVAVLVDEEQLTGLYEVEFEDTGLTSGIYFYKLKSNSFSDTKKMLLIK